MSLKLKTRIPSALAAHDALKEKGVNLFTPEELRGALRKNPSSFLENK